MSRLFKRALFGFRPGEVQNELNRLDNAHQEETAFLREDIEKAQAELKESETEIETLHTKLKEFASREQSIVDVMMLAQKKSLQVEEEARRQAKLMLETAEKELLGKKQELERLQEKLQRFKEEFKELLDDYRFSIENVAALPAEPEHVQGLTLLEGEKPEQTLKETLHKKDTY